MANYATNIFHARTENKTDLDKIEAFLDDTFSEFTNRYGDSVDAEFSSRWVYPEEEIKKLVESLEDKKNVLLRRRGTGAGRSKKIGRKDSARQYNAFHKAPMLIIYSKVKL